MLGINNKEKRGNLNKGMAILGLTFMLGQWSTPKEKISYGMIKYLQHQSSLISLYSPISLFLFFLLFFLIVLLLYFFVAFASPHFRTFRQAPHRPAPVIPVGT